jgi:predicted nucleic acid-binding protein
LNFLDTSILVGAAQTTHLHYEPSRKLVAEAKRNNTACGIHSLAETYSILSGLPRPHKLPPEAALRIVEQAREHMQVVNLTEKEYVATIQATVAA